MARIFLSFLLVHSLYFMEKKKKPTQQTENHRDYVPEH